MKNTITTTNNETFSGTESEVLAALIAKRFGWNMPAAAAAWRRMLQNSCSDQEFAVIVGLGRPLLRYLSKGA